MFDKLDADLARAVMSVGAVKGVEIGAGFAADRLTGSENNDPLTPEGFRTTGPVVFWGGFPTATKSSCGRRSSPSLPSKGNRIPSPGKGRPLNSIWKAGTIFRLSPAWSRSWKR